MIPLPNNFYSLLLHLLHFYSQVRYEGDPESALVQFSSPAEAKAAHDCAEAVLNNRFIKVYYLKQGGGPWKGKGGGGMGTQAEIMTNVSEGEKEEEEEEEEVVEEEEEGVFFLLLYEFLSPSRHLELWQWPTYDQTPFSSSIHKELVHLLV